MSFGEFAYLVLVIAVFMVFSAVLAWFSHMQSHADRRAKQADAPATRPSGAIAAH